MSVVQHKSADKTVTTIPDRNAISPRRDHMTVVVLDAIGDPQVLGGKATYKWNESTDSWLLLAKENADTLNFSSEFKTISGDAVTAANVPANGVIWDVYVMIDEASKVIVQVEWSVSGSVIGITPDAPGQFDGKKLHYKYAYGTVSQQMDAAMQSHTTATDPHPQYKATLDAPLSFTYTGTLAAPPTAYQTAPTLPAPSGGEWVGWVSMAQIGQGVSSITFPNLEGIGSTFSPTTMRALTSLSLPALTAVGSTCSPTTMPALTNLSLPALTTVGGTFGPSDMDALASLSLPALTTVGGAFSPNNMATLTSLSLPALTTVGGNFGTYNMATLTSLSLPVLTTVGGNFQSSSMAALTSLSLPALTTVGGAFSATTMPALTNLSLPALTTVGGTFGPTGMAALTSLSLPALTTVGSVFSPTTMPALTSLSLPALTTVGGNFGTAGMATLTSLSLPVLTTVGGNFQSSSMAALTSLSLPVLTTVGGTFAPHSMAALTSLSLPALTTMGGAFSLNNMAALTNLSLPAVERIGTVTAAGSNAIALPGDTNAIASFVLPATLKQVGGTGGNVSITSAALNQTSVDSILIRLAALDGTNGTVAFSNRIVTIKGTSVAPSVAGLTAKDTLVARGCSVTHN